MLTEMGSVNIAFSIRLADKLTLSHLKRVSVSSTPHRPLHFPNP